VFTLQIPVRRFLRFLLLASAVGYPLAIAAVTVLLATLGERWWPTTVGLYVPRVLFALPLPFIVLALLVWGPRWLLLLQAGAAALLLFPLMGLSLGRPAPATGPTLRVLSYNVDFGAHDRRQVVAQIVAAGADVIALQASELRLEGALAAALPRRHVHKHDEFYVASRYPLRDAHEPPPLAEGVPAGFLKITVDAPLGPVDLYVMHPRSPRRGFQAIQRTDGAVGPDKLAHNSDVRRRQVEALAAHARAAAHPVIIAGDTNLPVLSPLFRRQLGGYQDGWSEVGSGFGNTFPAHGFLPWMRIDRILAGRGLRFVDFEVGEGRGSDHLAVMATLCRD
jgi:endonuclease/exonuclease/phosphatase (EEP) superfamily protein YafD